jgi:hypothetical protein
MSACSLAWLIIALATAGASCVSRRVAAFHVHTFMQKNIYRRKIKFVYGYDYFEGVVTAK